MTTANFNLQPEVKFQGSEENEIMKQIDKYDATMLSYLARLYDGYFLCEIRILLYIQKNLEKW